MKEIKYIIIIAIVSLFTISCVEDIDLDLGNHDPILIIDGLVTNDNNPNIVRLTESKSTYGTTFDFVDENDAYIQTNYKPVLGATVIISDNEGTVDTLIRHFEEIVNVTYNSDTDTYDTTKWINHVVGSEGYYRTTKLKGKIGNTYTLKVIWKDKEYTATSTMRSVPEIDSVTYALTQGSEGKQNYYIPYIWFKDDASTRDYYLFKTPQSNSAWGRSILSDEFIGDEIKGLNVFQGETPAHWRNAYPNPGEYYEIEMYSINRDVFDYYKALIDQYRSDGGVYSPSPASPPTNIIGGAQGLFNAASIQVVRDTLPYEN